ncbi:SGNH/GDSL hydrolase family protein [bacterium]|nr:SGNH/GDSL hydrolase family protein [bacterium]
MKHIGRVDSIRSLTSFLATIAALALYFVFSELVLNFTTFRGVKNDFDYYKNLAFSTEESEKSEKFKRDIISLGDERQISIPGTIIFKYKPAERESFTLNSDGFRNKEFTEKAPDEFRIAIFGDSKIFGFAVQNDETIPSIVEQTLRKHFNKNITVLNMGIEGHDLQRAIATAKYFNEKIKPDMIVFSSGIIDLYSTFEKGNIDWEPFKGNEPLIPGIEGNPENATIYDKIRILKTIQYTHLSDIAKLVVRDSGADFPTFPLMPDKFAIAEQFPEIFLDRMTDATAFFDRLEIPSLFIFPPLMQTKRPLSENEKYLLFLNEITFPGINLFSLKCIEGIRNTLKTGKYGANIVDYSDIFQGEKETIFFDGLHYTPKFVRKMAEHVSDELIKILEKEKYLEKI